MTHRQIPALVLALAVVAAGAVAGVGAQSRDQMQIMADMRILQEQVQQLRQAISQLAEQNKAIVAKIDAQSEQARKNHADEQLLVKEMQRNIGTLEERLSQNTTQVGRLNGEVTALREGMTMLQQQQSQIMTQLTAVAPIGQPDTAGGGSGGGTANTQTGGGSMPASPSAYYNAAMGQYTSGQYDLAVEAFTEYLQKFPKGPDAPNAQYFLGMAHMFQNQNADALKAFQAIVANHPTSDRVAGAYIQQATIYEKMQKKTEAINMYKLVINKFPENTIEVSQAKVALARLGVR